MGTEAPPTVAPELTPLPDPPPHSRGTAAHAQIILDERYRISYHGERGAANDNLAQNLSIILNVQYDLKDRE